MAIQEISEKAETAADGPSRSGEIAAFAGAVFGAIAFALCALWIGAIAGIVIALISTISVLAWRHVPSAIAFVAAGTLSALALALAPHTALALLGAAAYGVGLMLAVRHARSAELLA